MSLLAPSSKILDLPLKRGLLYVSNLQFIKLHLKFDQAEINLEDFKFRAY